MEFSDKSIRKLIIPIVIEQTLAITMGIADTVMVSSCGEPVVSGISLVDQINVLLVSLFSALAAGGSIVVAQFMGHGDDKLVKKASAQLFLAVVFISTVFMCIAVIFDNSILNLLYKKLEPEVFSNASVYFCIVALSFPFLGIYNSGAALFRAIGNSKISMNISFVANIINIAGNALLIYGLKMGAAGAAAATLFSRIISSICIMYTLFRNKKLSFKITIRPDREMLKKILYISVPTGLENSIFQIGKLIVSTMTAGLGTVVITANAITNSIAGFQNIPSNAIGTGLITVTGQTIGAGDEKTAYKLIGKFLRTSYIYTAFLGVLIFAFARQICFIYNLSEETTDLVVLVLRFNCIMSILAHTPSFSLPNALRAAGDVRYTMTVAIASMWIFRIGLANILGLRLGYGLLGIWAAMTIDWIVRSIFYVYRLVSGKWLTHKDVIVGS